MNKSDADDVDLHVNVLNKSNQNEESKLHEGYLERSTQIFLENPNVPESWKVAIRSNPNFSKLLNAIEGEGQK